jgi:hypothetical protein
MALEVREAIFSTPKEDFPGLNSGRDIPPRSFYRLVLFRGAQSEMAGEDPDLSGLQ